MNFIHFTIAHEIGHVMTGTMQHPGETGYALELEWPTRYDPYLKKRLMCPGKKVSLSLLGTCFIKMEWDLIEAWLHENVDPKL